MVSSLARSVNWYGSSGLELLFDVLRPVSQHDYPPATPIPADMKVTGPPAAFADTKVLPGRTCGHT